MQKLNLLTLNILIEKDLFPNTEAHKISNRVRASAVFNRRDTVVFVVTAEAIGKGGKERGQM